MAQCLRNGFPVVFFIILERFKSLARLICFLALTVIVFLDIWVSFGATWVVGIQGEQRMQNNQKVESLWSHCDLQPNYKSEQCDTLFSSIGGPSIDGGKYLVWRAMTIISVLSFATAAACCLLSLDCVLMTDSKRWTALAAGCFSLFSGMLLAITAVWYSIDMTTRNVGFSSLGGGGRSSLSTRVDIYNQRPGPGLIFAYIMALIAVIIGACLIIYSRDEESYDPEINNGRRPSMPMSMISGFPNRQTVIRKQSEGLESVYGSKHSIEGLERTPRGQMDYI